MGIQISDNRTLYTLHFANDQVVIAQDKEDLEYMTRKLLKEYEELGAVGKPFQNQILMYWRRQR